VLQKQLAHITVRSVLAFQPNERRRRGLQGEILKMLVNRNITVDGHRTSIRLEPEFWAGLADIAQSEDLTIDQLCTEVDHGAGELSRTAAIRVFITSYIARQAQQAAGQLQRSYKSATDGYAEPQGTDEYPMVAQRFRAAS
jgi:predicted DNA-binding ribbon-helix-helix protein